jgi:carbon-monoxide dehydrogenase small subunit/xanthine dehydrogenase small subunit
MKLEFELNGKKICLDVPGDRRAVDLFREDLGLTGTKEGCGTGECGACTVLVDGRSQLSCLMLAAQLQGRKVVTIEGLAPEGTLHPVQESFAAKGAVQCGFCTPGMVLTTVDLLERRPHPDRREVRQAISGNLCRCTGYTKIVEAIEGVGQQATVALPLQEKIKRIQPATATGSRTKQNCPVFLPESLDELWRLLADHPGARVFTGGTDLLVWMRSGRIKPAALIGLERMEALQGIIETDDGVRIGAGVTHETLLESPVIGRLFPVLTQALKVLGSPHIRHRGTIGGNIMTASPAGDTLPPLTTLGASVEMRSAHSVRSLPVEAFIRGPGRTALAPGEILAAVFLPRPVGRNFQHFEKVGLREAMACAVASLAAVLGVSESGTIKSAHLAWGSVGPTVMRLPEIESALVGCPFHRETFEAAVPLVGQRLSPISDVRASAAYRKLVAGNLLLRLPAVFSSSDPGAGSFTESDT